MQPLSSNKQLLAKTPFSAFSSVMLENKTVSFVSAPTKTVSEQTTLAVNDNINKSNSNVTPRNSSQSSTVLVSSSKNEVRTASSAQSESVTSKYDISKQKYKEAKDKAKFFYNAITDKKLDASIGEVITSVTDCIVTLLLLTSGLYFVQKNFNEKFLINFLNEKFSSKIPYDLKLRTLAGKMLNEHNLFEKIRFFASDKKDAYYTATQNAVVFGPGKHSAIFHEIGHAIIQNNTKFLSKLQDGRGNFTIISILLTGLVSGKSSLNELFRKNSDKSTKSQKVSDKKTSSAAKNENATPKTKVVAQNNTQRNKSFGAKLKDFIKNNPFLIPLAAYSPELVTEAGASGYALKFLKRELKAGNISKSYYRNIRNSYITCFSTYFFIPISIVLVSMLNSKLDKAKDIKVKKKYRQQDALLMLRTTLFAPFAGLAISTALSGKLKGTERFKYMSKVTGKITLGAMFAVFLFNRLKYMTKPYENRKFKRKKVRRTPQKKQCTEPPTISKSRRI